MGFYPKNHQDFNGYLLGVSTLMAVDQNLSSACDFNGIFLFVRVH